MVLHCSDAGDQFSYWSISTGSDYGYCIDWPNPKASGYFQRPCLPHNLGLQWRTFTDNRKTWEMQPSVTVTQLSVSTDLNAIVDNAVSFYDKEVSSSNKDSLE